MNSFYRDLMNIQFLRTSAGMNKQFNQSFKIPQRSESNQRQRVSAGEFGGVLSSGDLLADQDSKRNEIALAQQKQFLFEFEQLLSQKVNIPPIIDPETFEKVPPSTQVEGLLWILDRVFNSPFGVRPKDLNLLRSLFIKPSQTTPNEQNQDTSQQQTQRQQFETFQLIVQTIQILRENSKKVLNSLKEANLEIRTLNSKISKPKSPIAGSGSQLSSFQKISKLNIAAEQTKREDLKQQIQSKDKELDDYKQKFEIMKQALKQLELQNRESQGGILQLEMPQTSIDVDYASRMSDQNQEFNKLHRQLGLIVAQVKDALRSNTSGEVEDGGTSGLGTGRLMDEQAREMLIQGLENQYEKMKQVQDIFLDENSSLYERKTELQSRLDTMQKNTKYLEGKLASTITEKEEQIIKLKSEIVIYKNKIAAYKSKLREAVNGFETKKLQEMQQKQSKEIETRDIQIAEQKSQLESLTQSNSQLQDQVEQLIGQIDESAQTNKAQVNELNLIITQLSTRLKDIDQDYSHQLSQVDNIRDITQKRLNIEQKERTLNSLKLEYLINNYRKLDLQKRFLQQTLDKDMRNLTQEMRKAEIEMQREVYVTTQSAQTRLTSMYTVLKDSLKYVKEVIGFMNFEVDRVQEQDHEYAKLQTEIQEGKEGMNVFLQGTSSKSKANLKSQTEEDPIERYERLQQESQLMQYKEVNKDQEEGQQMLVSNNLSSQSMTQQREREGFSQSQLGGGVQSPPVLNKPTLNNQIQPSNKHITSLDQCYYKHIYELCEVLLSILSEIYKDSRTQTAQETVQLFDLLQQKTDKGVVSEIYNKFFSANRIHFAQFMGKQQERLYDLQQERADLKIQVHRLNSQLNEIAAEQEREQQEELRLIQQQQEQEQLHLRDLGIIDDDNPNSNLLMHQNSDSLVIAGSGNIANNYSGNGQLPAGSPLNNINFLGSNIGQNSQHQKQHQQQLQHHNLNPRASVDIPKSQNLLLQIQRHSTLNQQVNKHDELSTSGQINAGEQSLNNTNMMSGFNPLSMTKQSFNQLQSPMSSNSFAQNTPTAAQQNQQASSNPLRDLLLSVQNRSSIPPSATNRPSTTNPFGAVASALFKSQEKRIVEILNAENQALKERVRETRLMFQKQINQLQEQMRLLKDQHFSEINKIKIEYGRDLGILHKTQKQKEAELHQDLSLQHQERIEEILKEHQETISKVKAEDQQRYEELKMKYDKIEIIRQELDRELKKLKKQSNLVAQGGWGTFAIAIETTPKKYYNLQSMSTTGLNLGGLTSPQKSTIDAFKELTAGGGHNNITPSSRKLSSQSSNENNQLDHDNSTDKQPREDLSLKQLSHFIEVGFLMDQKNFNFIDVYREKTYDSQLTKYLFEFQDPITNHQMLQLQNKIKQQLVENFALFNEINPVYVTLNLGRTISPFYGDDSLSMDHFKLIKREGLELNGGTHQLMVNFLKCEEPQIIIRVIAFDSEKCQQHSFDLIFEDLMLLVDGNMKLLEEDHLGDLCQIILNNLTMIKRGTLSNNQKKKKNQIHFAQESEIISNFDENFLTSNNNQSQVDDTQSSLYQRRTGKETDQPTLQQHPSSAPHHTVGVGLNESGTLAVEHKLFFNDSYKIEYDKSNRVILGKHDKKKKGLVQEKSMITDFEKSVIYEAFESVYSETVSINTGHGQVRNLKLVMKKGKISQHMILNVEDQDLKYQQDIMLYFSSEYAKNNQSHHLSTEIVKFPTDLQSKILTDPIHQKPLALLVSYEKLYGLQHFVVRLVLVTKYDSLSMTDFDWRPEDGMLQHGSLSYHQQTLYLVKQANNHYLRVKNYEILNTELRSMIFMLSYGYEQSLIDFGKFKALEGIDIKTPLEKQQYSTLQLIFREFGIIRVKHYKVREKREKKKSPARDQIDSDLEEDNEAHTQVQNRRSNYNAKSDDEEDDRDREDDEDQNQFYYENSFCIYTFYDDMSCLHQQEVHLNLRIHNSGSSNIEITEKIKVAEVVSELDMAGIKKNQERVCKLIFDKLVLEQRGDQYSIKVDKNIQPMSEVIEEIKRKKFLTQIDQEDLMETELDPKQMQISLNQLAECQKLTQVSIINRKVFKVTSYFLTNLKNLKLGQSSAVSTIQSSQAQTTKKLFDWQVLYLDCYQRLQAKSHIILITENDLLEINAKLKSQLNQSGGDYQQILKVYDETEFFNSKVKKERIIDFILDCVVFNESKQQLQLSLSHFKSRLEDRVKLDYQFKLSGSKFITKSGQIEDTDLLIYKTSLPQIELNRKLLLNVEKDFSDKRYDIKLFELSLHSYSTSLSSQSALDQHKKYTLELYCIEQPQSIFKADFYSSAHAKGKKIMIERFNIIQQMHKDYEESKFMRDGMVLGIVEQSFPHQIVFMLLEPASHIQWQFILQTDKLNQIETRVDKEFLIAMAKESLDGSLVEGIDSIERVVPIEKLGYQKISSQQNDSIDLWQGNLKNSLNDSNTLIYAKNLEVKLLNSSETPNSGESVFLEFSIFSDRLFNSLKLQVAHSTFDQPITISISIDTQRESSRFLAGYFCLDNLNSLKLLYIVETSQAYTQQEKAIRVKILEPQLSQQLCDVVLAEKHLIAQKQNQDSKSYNCLKDELKFAFNTGFKDSYSLFQKLPDIVPDFKKAFLPPLHRLNYSKAEDTSKLLYRKVYKLSQGHGSKSKTATGVMSQENNSNNSNNGQNSNGGENLIVQVKYETVELAEKEWVVVLFDQKNSYEVSFIFKLDLILTRDEINSLNAKNDRIMRDVVSRVVDKRLRVKVLDEKYELVKLTQHSNGFSDFSRKSRILSATSSQTPLQQLPYKRYLAYFIDPPLGVASDLKKFTQLHNFDIRNGFRFSLTNAESMQPEIMENERNESQKPQRQQERLIVHLEKDDLFFDVSELLNPFELILRIKTYQKETLKMISASDIKEHDIRKELLRDQVSFLIEPQKREELSKYIVQNIYYDESRQRVFFLKSHNGQIQTNIVGVNENLQASKDVGV